MSGPRQIDFVTLGGPANGMGHVMRCAALAAEARRRDWQVRAFIEAPSSVRTLWSEITSCEPPAPWRDWRPRPNPSIVALDFPRDKVTWLDRLAGQGQTSLVIDDPTARERADWTLLPALHHASDFHALPRVSPKSQTGHLLVGPRYSILSDAHLNAARAGALPRTRLLLSMGGADPYRLTLRLAPLVRQAIEETLNSGGITGCDVVLGPAFVDPEGEEAARLRAAGWRVHSAIAAETMAQLMRRARLALIGFGTSLTELAYHRTPFLTVTHHDHDRAPARDLETEGIGRVLGTAGDLDPDRVRRRIRAALEDDAWLQESAAHAFERIDGGAGSRRIFEALENEAPRSSPGLPGRSKAPPPLSP